MKSKLFLIIIHLIYFEIISLIFIGCKNDDFSPIGNYEDKLVVYCVLDSRSKTQYVKIQHVFLKDGSGKIDSNKIIKNAKVIIIDNNGRVFNFKDTTIINLTSYSLYYNNDIVLKAGGYTLLVEADGYSSVWSTVNVPVEQKTYVEYKVGELNLLFSPNLNSKGFIYHLLIDYQIYDYGKITSHTIEAPNKMTILKDNDNKLDTVVFYPQLTRRSSTPYQIETIKIDPQVLIYALSKINPNDKTKFLTVTRGYLVSINFDWNLYDYLNIIKGFSDSYSVRLDQPNWTNFSDGYGIFGAITFDIIPVWISKEYIDKFGYTNGQSPI